MRRNKALNREIGKRIRQAREEAGLTQSELAELIGIGKKKLLSIENGEGYLNADTLRVICLALSVSSDSLLENIM